MFSGSSTPRQTIAVLSSKKIFKLMFTKSLQKILYFKNPKKYTDNVLTFLIRKKKSDIYSKLPGLSYSSYRGFSPWQYHINKQVSSLKIQLNTAKKMTLVLHKVDIWIQNSVGEISLIKKNMTFNSSSLSKTSASPEDINASHLKYTRTFETNDGDGERYWEADFNTPQHILRVDVYGRKTSNCIKDVCVSVKDENGSIVASQCRGDSHFMASQVITQIIPTIASIARFLHDDGHKDSAVSLIEAFYALCTAQHSAEVKQCLLSELMDSFDNTLNDTPDFGVSPKEGLILDLLPGDTEIEFNNIGTPNLKLKAVFSSERLPIEDTEPLGFKQIRPVKQEAYRYQLTEKIPSAIRSNTFNLNFPPMEAKSKVALYGGKGSVNKNGFIREVRIYNLNNGWRIENTTFDRYKCLIDMLTFIEWLTGPAITSEVVSTAAKLCATYRFENMRLFKSLYRKDKTLLELTIKTIKEKGCTAKYHQDVIFTRHGISVPFAVKNDEHLVNCMYDFCQWLEKSLDLKAFPLYGTLLGIHREDRFLPHDDDIDLAVVVDLPEGMSPPQATRQWQARIEAAGIKCNALIASATNMHVQFTGHEMDLFIIYRNYGANNNAYGHMQQYKLREFPQTLLEPLSTLVFRGKTFYAPADIPGFLEERYGSGWTEPDPTYEM